METTSSSSSDDDLSSSECEELEESSCEPEDDEEKLEIANICGATLQLPQLLCESKEIFKEFFSLKTFNSLSEINKQHLKNFLPSFPENDEQEKNTTLQKLFNRETFRFNSPLVQFHDKLKAGHFRPDIARMRKLLKQEQKKEYKYQQKVYSKKLLHNLMVSRHHLLDVANNLPPGIEPRIEKLDKNSMNSDSSPKAFRAKKRYFQELAQIKSQVDDTMDWSEDENYPEGPPMRLSKKLKRHLNGLQNSGSFQNVPNSEKTVVSTLSSKPSGMDLENSVTSTYNPYQLNEESYRALLFAHKKRKSSFDVNPELITKGISLRDIAQRTQLTPSKKSINYKSVHHGTSTSSNSTHHDLTYQRSSTSTSKKKKNDSSTSNYYKLSNSSTVRSISSPEISKLHTVNSIAPSSNSEQENSDSDEYIDPVLSPTPIKSKSPRSRTPRPKTSSQTNSPRSNKSKTSSNITTNLNQEFNIIHNKLDKLPEKSTETSNIKLQTEIKVEESPTSHPQISISDNLISPINHQFSSRSSRIIPASLSDLDGIDMMSLPVDLEDSNIDILDDIDAIDNQENTIKDELLNIETNNIKHELLMQETHSNFLSLIRDIICSTVEHRMSLNDIEERLKSWQTNPISPLNTWYSLVDNWLNLLPSAISFLTGDMIETPEDYVPYLEYKPNLHLYQWIGAGRDSDNLLNSLCQFWLEHRDDNAQNILNTTTSNIKIKNTNIQQHADENIIVKPATPPPPRFPTNWVVRKAEPQEIDEFRDQERQRYANPHKSFTYKMNGYESIVGPVKGMYNQTSGLSKARGHSMLNADRPNFVTILTLVRDAVARLPNGEGTRTDICELLKSSQYISQCAPENVLQSVVSGALDRLHTEYDPSVKYDTKKKIWIYLHRNRSEADFERIHQQFQGLSKQFKKNSRKNKATKPKTEKNTTVPTAVANNTIKTNISNNKQTIVTNKQINLNDIAATATTSNISDISDTLVVPQTNINSEKISSVNAKQFKTPPMNRLFTVSTAATSPTNVQLPTQSPNKQPAGTSLLVTSNISTIKQTNSPKAVGKTVEKVESDTGIKNIAATSSSNVNNSNINQQDKQPERQIKIIASTIAPTEQDIEKAIQTLTPIRVASPINTNKQLAGAKTQKSLVKIINSPQGKSLISPIASASNNQATVFIKQIDSKSTIAGKNIISQPQITQQLLQTIAAQQKLKTSQLQQQPQQNQQIIKQSVIVTSQQLIKPDTQKTIQTIASGQQILQSPSNQQISVSTNQTNISQQLLQAISQQQKSVNLNQQQQILQTIKQKVQNQQSVLTLQQAINKQANIQQLQKQLQQNQQQINKGTSLLGQQRIITQVGGTKSATGTQNQTPLVAKVLTNAAGQVISVESLLAHQKQHGTLPQGTTLRVSGAKPGQTNLIQLSGSTANQIQQFAVVSQNNIVSLAGSNRLTTVTTNQNVSPATSNVSVTSVVTAAKTITTKTQTPNKQQTKFLSTTSKLAHQLVNAKFVTQNVTGNTKLLPQQKIVQVNQPVKINASVKQQNVATTVTSNKLANAVVTATSSHQQQTQNISNVRMVNTTSLNLASFAGKPVLLASKGNTIQNLQSLQNLQGQNVILQAQPNLQTSNSIVIPNNARVITQGTSNLNVIQANPQPVSQSAQNATGAQVVLGTQLNQIKVQNLVQQTSNNQQIVLTGQNLKPANSVVNSPQSGQNTTQTVVLGGAIKMSGTNNRVVLASQGSSGQIVTQQILLPSNFQGGAINIKTLQGLKVIPLAQTTQQTKGRPQVFARIMNPQNARITQVTNTQNSTQLNDGGSQTNNTE